MTSADDEKDGLPDEPKKFEPLDVPLPSRSSSHDTDHEEHEEHEEQLEYSDPEKGLAETNQRGTRPQPPAISRSISTQSKPLSLRKVPVSQRNGWLSRLSLLYEAEEPKSYPRKVKWFITFEVAIAAIAAPMGSAIILRAFSSACDMLLVRLTREKPP